MQASVRVRERVAHIGVDSLRTRSAILRLSSSTRPIHQHHRVVIMEAAASSRVRIWKARWAGHCMFEKKAFGKTRN